MGAAAGADVRARNGHDAHLAVDLFFAAVGQLGQLLRGGVGDDHRHVLPDDAVGGKLRPAQALGGDGHAGVHPHGFRPDVETHVLRPEHLVQDAGEDVFAGVLLHLVKPPLPVEPGGHHSPRDSFRRKLVHRVPDDPAVFVDIQHRNAGAVRQAQHADVRRLPAALRVKYRAVQHDASAAGLFVRFGGKDDTFRFGAEGILLIVFLGALHGARTSNAKDKMARPLSFALLSSSPKGRALGKTGKLTVLPKPLPLGEVARRQP